MKLVECVPNFSEGRRKDIVGSIAAEIESVDGVSLLDQSMDPDHNRAVLTFLGHPEAVSEAAFRSCRRAAELIDMDAHRGEHKRMGATDVIPFVPVRDVGMDECVEIAKSVGRRIGEELGIPVYLYEAAASSPGRVSLADVRRGEYEGIRREILTNPGRKPDFGPSRLGSAGATAVGAREFLIAFNVNLGTKDVQAAKDMAKIVRESSGGYRCVKAMGFEIKERGITQVSMNMTNYKVTPLRVVFDRIVQEAGSRGIRVVGSELVGLAPQAAIPPGDEKYLMIEKFDNRQIIENRL